PNKASDEGFAMTILPCSSTINIPSVANSKSALNISSCKRLLYAIGHKDKKIWFQANMRFEKKK
ncbi:hypothetical protein, partial [Salmonella enterica]|uniref:hypothetical protein n=1 Tax=Salmonella enterica TaxID=28901 RepID=UPI003D2C9EBE